MFELEFRPVTHGFVVVLQFRMFIAYVALWPSIVRSPITENGEGWLSLLPHA
jgi:hypothetical protein